jgi:excisionase family DNA binding protein
MSIPTESLLTVQKVADYLRADQRIVYRLVMGRKLPCFKVGTTCRFKRAAIDGCIAAQASSASETGSGAGGKGEDNNA